MIRDHQLCPCGSGQTFANCHKATEVEWEEVGLDYQGEMKYMNQTLFKTTVQALTPLLRDELSEVNTVTEGIDLLEKVYSTLEPLGDQISSQSSCKKGCAHCCYKPVECSPIEAKYIKNKLGATYETQWKPKVDSIKPEQPQPNDTQGMYNYIYKQIPCPFLMDDQSCGIYEIRPIACRKYFVLNDPNICATPGQQTIEWQNKAFEVLAMNIIIGLSRRLYPHKKYRLLPNAL